MSRTYNTMPYDIQKETKELWRSLDKGYPQAFGGAWPSRGRWATLRNRQFRRKAKILLKQDKDIPVNVKTVAWDMW